MKKEFKSIERLQTSVTNILLEVNDELREIAENGRDLSMELINDRALLKEFDELNKFTVGIKQTKLQPSVISLVSGVDGLEGLMGINLSEVDLNNRVQMTQAAVEGLVSSLKNVASHIYERIAKLIERLKKFVLSINNPIKRIKFALADIEHFIGHELQNHTYDETVFSMKKLKCYDYTDYKLLLNNIKGLIAETLKLFHNMSSGVYSWSDQHLKGMKLMLVDVNPHGPKHYKIVEYDPSNKLNKTKVEMHKLNWTVKLLFSFIAPIKENIRNYELLSDLIVKWEDREYSSYVDNAIMTEDEIKEAKIKAEMVFSNYSASFAAFEEITDAVMETSMQFIRMFKLIKFHKKGI